MESAAFAIKVLVLDTSHTSTTARLSRLNLLYFGELESPDYHSLVKRSAYIFEEQLSTVHH